MLIKFYSSKKAYHLKILQGGPEALKILLENL
jgi:hypothetical protein